MSDPQASATSLVKVPIRDALSSSRQVRFLGLTLDDAIKYFFGGNALIAIIVLFLICYSLASQAIGFPRQNKENLTVYRRAGLEYVDLLRGQVDDFTKMSRTLNELRLQAMNRLQAKNRSEDEIKSALQPFDNFKDKFDDLITPHQSMLSDWTAQVSDLKDRMRVNAENIASQAAFRNKGMLENAAALKIEDINYAKETKSLRDLFPAYQDLNHTLNGALTKISESLPVLPVPDVQSKFAHFPHWVTEYTAQFPVIEEEMQSWDPNKPVPLYQSMTSFFFGTQWITNSFWQDWYGLIPLLVGSLCVSGVALVIAVPFGLSAAIYINQIATRAEQQFIKPYIEFISAIPSVVLGFFGIAVLGTAIRAATQSPLLSWIPGFPISERLNIFTAGCLLAFMAIPTIFTLAEDALNNVPRSYVEASTALGSTKLQTIIKIMVPAALSGIISAILLGLGRVIGETMVVLLCVGGRIQIPDFSQGLSAFFQPAHTMTGIIAQEMGEVVQRSIHFRALFMIGVVLFFISLVINYVAQQMVKKYKISIG